MTPHKKLLLFIVADIAVLGALFFVWRSGALNSYLPLFLTTNEPGEYEREIHTSYSGDSEGSGNSTDISPTLSEGEAEAIAGASCIKGGGALSSGGMYNPNSRTWWFDANLNATREGCHPACVVDEETKTAEINWRCTGLVVPDPTDPVTPPESGTCEIENCHGLDIVCGPRPVEMCTMIYQLGDRCRQFAECGMVGGACQQLENPKFTACKSCVQQCEADSADDPEKAFECESRCGE